MAEFRLTLLGDFALSGISCAALSKKARALVAYLAIPAGQAHRRDKLASMLWSDRAEEAARQNLRQCLSAIRKVSETGGAIPIVAEGDLLRLDPTKLAIDVCEFEQTLRSREPEQLARACTLYRGELLAGLNLQGEPFEEWLIGERQRLRAAAIEGLMRLLEHQQHSGTHHAAMQTALRLLAIDPLQEGVHRSVMRLYHETGNTAQALRQYGICEKVLRRELNVEPEGATKDLRRDILRRRGESPRPTSDNTDSQSAYEHPPRASTRTQEITFCRTEDGVNLAMACAGQGSPLIGIPPWLTHLEYDWQGPIRGPLWQFLADRFRLIRYDGRGLGLSDRDVADISFATFERDLEAVLNALNLRRYALLGISQGAATAIAHAARHPERVSRMVIVGSFARGRNRRAEKDAILGKAFLDIMREGWGDESAALLSIYSTVYLPSASAEQLKWHVRLQRACTSAETAVRLRQTCDEVDVADLLPKVSAPTLVLHSRYDNAAPFDEGRRIAGSIRNAKLVSLESGNHYPLPGEPAWTAYLQAMESFLSE